MINLPEYNVASNHGKALIVIPEIFMVCSNKEACSEPEMIPVVSLYCIEMF